MTNSSNFSVGSASKGGAAATYSSKITISNPSGAIIAPPSKKGLQNASSATELMNTSQSASDSRKLREARVLRGKQQASAASSGNIGNAQSSAAIFWNPDHVLSFGFSTVSLHVWHLKYSMPDWYQPA